MTNTILIHALDRKFPDAYHKVARPLKKNLGRLGIHFGPRYTDLPKVDSDTTRQSCAGMVSGLQKTVSLQAAVKAVAQQKNRPAAKLGVHRAAVAQMQGATDKTGQKQKPKTNDTAKKLVNFDAIIASIEDDMFQTKEEAKMRGGQADSRLWEVNKVLAVPQALAASKDPRLGVVGRLTAFATVNDDKIRGEIGDLTLGEALDWEQNDAESGAQELSYAEIEAVIATPRLVEPYIEHCKRQVALSEGVSQNAVQLADAALSTNP